MPPLSAISSEQPAGLENEETPSDGGGFLATMLGTRDVAPSPPPVNSRPDEAARNVAAIGAFVALTAWTVVTVDSGVARGWTLDEVRWAIGGTGLGFVEIVYADAYVCVIVLVNEASRRAHPATGPPLHAER
jgi:hypothetical protein